MKLNVTVMHSRVIMGNSHKIHHIVFKNPIEDAFIDSSYDVSGLRLKSL